MDISKIKRMAGDVWEGFSENFLNHGAKANAGTLETIKSVGADGEKVDWNQTALDVGRAGLAGLHPALGALDDSIDLANHTKDIGNTGASLQQRSASVMRGLQSAAGLATAAGPLAPAAPFLAIPGTAIAIGVPAAERMTNDEIRRPDIEAYREAMGGTAEGYRVNRY